ncbi:ribosomal protein L10 domain containing protein [Aphelenchoides avenae]|nr:ribosomal protein L10 domain containing protein [Aphelenchus avenae]
MPRSKRDKEVSLTKVKKKTRETKENLIQEVRASVEKYANVFVYSIENMRSKKFLDIRQKYKSNSRFFYGKNNVMSLALGRSAENEVAEGISKLCSCLKGQCGLMFTNAPSDDVKRFFEEYAEEDYARAGQMAEQEISLEQGPLKQFAFSMEPQLRKLGLPTKLEKGVIELHKPFTVCNEGDVLNAEQAKILKLLDIKMSLFKVALTGHWSKDSDFTALA